MSNVKGVPLEGLSDAIMEALMEYNQEASDKLKDGLKKLAKETADEIKGSSPRKTGEYAKGWGVKEAYQSDYDIRITVYNKKKPGLTHLLEHGHAKVGGGRVSGVEHIAPAEANMMQKAIKVVEDAYGK